MNNEQVVFLKSFLFSYPFLRKNQVKWKNKEMPYK
nr:MAG TPA: hypothetical protein [Caudoviricetes sp.]